MRERPIEFSCFGIERAELERTIINAGHRDDFRIIPRREYLIRFLEVSIREGFFDHGHAGSAQQPRLHAGV